MARPLRIEFEGALYHVMARGNAQADIFLDDEDRQAFVDNLDRVCRRFDWRVWAWCQMSNHYEREFIQGQVWFSVLFRRSWKPKVGACIACRRAGGMLRVLRPTFRAVSSPSSCQCTTPQSHASLLDVSAETRAPNVDIETSS